MTDMMIKCSNTLSYRNFSLTDIDDAALVPTEIADQLSHIRELISTGGRSLESFEEVREIFYAIYAQSQTLSPLTRQVTLTAAMTRLQFGEEEAPGWYGLLVAEAISALLECSTLTDADRCELWVHLAAQAAKSRSVEASVGSSEGLLAQARRYGNRRTVRGHMAWMFPRDRSAR